MTHDSGRTLTATEQRNLATIDRWSELWNVDVMGCVDLYADDLEFHEVIGGNLCRGRAEMRAIEQSLIALDPSRRITVLRKFASGNEVAIEFDTAWQDGAHVIKGVALMTFNEAGEITSDHTYTTIPQSVLANAAALGFAPPTAA